MNWKYLIQEEKNADFFEHNRKKFICEVAEYLRQHNWYKACLPNSYGGKELTIFQFIEYTEKLSFLDANLGWRFQIGNGATYFVKNFSPELAKELFSMDGFLIAGSGSPSGVLFRNRNRMHVKGVWEYCSGMDIATHISFVCVDHSSKQQVAAILPISAKMEKRNSDWFALQHTATHAISLDAFEINGESLFMLNEVLNPVKIPAFELPFDVFARAFFIPVVFGAFRRYLQELTVFLKKKGNSKGLLEVETTLKEFTVQKNFVLLNLQKQEYTTFNEQVWQIVEYIRLQLVHTIPLAGMHGIKNGNGISANFLNLLALTQHHFLHKSYK